MLPEIQPGILPGILLYNSGIPLKILPGFPLGFFLEFQQEFFQEFQQESFQEFQQESFQEFLHTGKNFYSVAKDGNTHLQSQLSTR